MNGRFLTNVEDKDGKSFAAGTQVPGFAQLRDDGTTMSGNWIYCGSFTEQGNLAIRRDMTDAPNKIGLHPNWAWVWPMNRRILYNRASVNRKGEPFNPRKWVIRWNAEKKAWEGDVPDGAHAAWRNKPIHHAVVGRGTPLFAGSRRRPIPRALRAGGEPGEESVLENPMESVRRSLAVDRIRRYGTAAEFPIVATTYRVSEHWQTGAMSRNMPWLVGLAPNAFVEIGTALAQRLGIKSGDHVIVSSARGSIEVYALVTERFQPFFVEGRIIDEIGLPWHWGYAGIVPGDIANDLTASVGDPNSKIPETKVFLCNLRKKETA